MDFTVRYNVMNISSIKAFAQINGTVQGSCRDVYFIRALGANPDLCTDIEAVDKLLTERNQHSQVKYFRIDALPRLTENSEIEYYKNAYEIWKNNGKSAIPLKSNNTEEMKVLTGKAFCGVLEKFRTGSAGMSESIERNFATKLMFWMDKTAEIFLKDRKMSDSCKFIYSGTLKKQEYLFCYLLTLMGIDVLMILPEKDAEVPDELLGLSAKLELGKFGKLNIPEYRPERRELSFEELALSASSIVMIAIHDKNGEVLGSGSGIMISEDGYILTNNHVACGGCFYSVRIEDDDKIYQTDEMIKYNQFFDLAIIRIDRKLKPVPFYRGEKPLVRGQKVVAIGSPLGLFNSVSDGIISGFRKIDNVDMIQFTAPTSHGSSGGAVFNMYGEVIGISTAGIDSGQNLNLAVGYECINHFIQGFYKV